MAITFLKLAEMVLNETDTALSYNEIWQRAVDKGYADMLQSEGKTPQNSLSARLLVDIRDNPNSLFTSIGERPKRYGLKRKLVMPIGDATELLEPSSQPTQSTKVPYTELDLHPLMVYFGSQYLNLFLKTIKHTLSEKKPYGEWVHPDIVGCYYPFIALQPEVVDVSALMGNSAAKFYSFELKKELSFSNLRESFFQAVSNSSWANEGYLVAARIDNGSEFMDELKRLTAAFGIGIIELDTEDPDACKILFPARTKEQIDWDSVNKLSAMNPDFKKLLQRVKNDISIHEIKRDGFDKVLTREELLKKYN